MCSLWSGGGGGGGNVGGVVGGVRGDGVGVGAYIVVYRSGVLVGLLRFVELISLL